MFIGSIIYKCILSSLTMPEDPALAQAQALAQAPAQAAVHAVVNSYPQLFRQDAMERFPSAPTGSETGAGPEAEAEPEADAEPEPELLWQDAMDQVPSRQEGPPPIKRQKRIACVLQD